MQRVLTYNPALDNAKRNLQHYFRLIASKTDLRWDGDNEAEVADIADYLFDAVLAELEAREKEKGA
jgi:hypothetical protein